MCIRESENLFLLVDDKAGEMDVRNDNMIFMRLWFRTG